MRSRAFGPLAKAGLFALVVQGTGGALIAVLDVLLARAMGVAEFGIYASVLAWLFMLVILGTLGFTHVLLRFVPVYRARQEWAYARGVLQFSTRAAGLGAVALALGFVVVGWLALADRDVPATVVMVAAVALPLQVLTALRQAALRGCGLIPRSLIPDLIVRPLVILCLVAALVAFERSVRAVDVVAIHLVAVTLAFALAAHWLRRALPSELRAAPPQFAAREWLRSAGPLFLVVVLGMFDGGRIDPAVVAPIHGVEAAGAYAAANRLAEVLLLAIATANAVIAPAIAKLHSSQDRAELVRLVRRVVALLASFSVLAFAGFALTGEALLGMFGDGFSLAYVPMLILVAAQLVGAASGPVLFLLTMTGYQRHAATALAVAVTLKSAVAVMLVPSFGSVGMALATLTCAVTWNVWMRWAVLRELGFDPSVLALFKAQRARNS